MSHSYAKIVSYNSRDNSWTVGFSTEACAAFFMRYPRWREANNAVARFNWDNQLTAESKAYHAEQAARFFERQSQRLKRDAEAVRAGKDPYLEPKPAKNVYPPRFRAWDVLLDDGRALVGAKPAGSPRYGFGA